MRILNQLRFIASNVLSEVAEGVDDFRIGVVPEVRVEANHILDQAETFVDSTLVKIQSGVLELREELVNQASG